MPAPPATAEYRRAGIVTRLLAALVDGGVTVLLLAALYLGTAGLLFILAPTRFTWPAPTLLFTMVTAALLATAYLTVAWATTGRTLGASLLGLRVLSARRELLGWPRSVLRATFCVMFPAGLLWAAVSRTRSSMQDIVLRSVVVYDWHRDGGVRARSSDLAA